MLDNRRHRLIKTSAQGGSFSTAIRTQPNLGPENPTDPRSGNCTRRRIRKRGAAKSAPLSTFHSKQNKTQTRLERESRSFDSHKNRTSKKPRQTDSSQSRLMFGCVSTDLRFGFQSEIGFERRNNVSRSVRNVVETRSVCKQQLE